MFKSFISSKIAQGFKNRKLHLFTLSLGFVTQMASAGDIQHLTLERVQEQIGQNNQEVRDTFLEDKSTGPIAPFEPGLIRDSNSFLSKVPVVIWVNAATQGSGPLAQRAIIYVNGKESLRSVVSTGVEGKSTATGYFYGDALEVKHFSHKYHAWMPYTMFWYGGYATHQAPTGTEPKLGTRASHGCVRMPEATAKFIYLTGRQVGRGTIPEFSRRGRDLGKTADGKIRVIVVVENRPDANF